MNLSSGVLILLLFLLSKLNPSLSQMIGQLALWLITSNYLFNYKLYGVPFQLVLDLLVHLIGRYLGLLGLKGGGADEVGRSLASLLTLTVTFNCRHPLLPLLLPSCCQQHLLTFTRQGELSPPAFLRPQCYTRFRRQAHKVPQVRPRHDTCWGSRGRGEGGEVEEEKRECCGEGFQTHGRREGTREAVVQRGRARCKLGTLFFVN